MEATNIKTHKIIYIYILEFSYCQTKLSSIKSGKPLEN